MKYQWDPKKAASNIVDHDGVTFEEAQTVFADPNRVELFDDDNAQGEPRIQVIGFSAKPRLLFVVVFEVDDDVTRIISARHATPHEVKQYAQESQK